MARRLWFECSHSHRRTIDKPLLRSGKAVAVFLTKIQALHAKLYPACRAELIRVAATQKGIQQNQGAATFRIDYSQRLILPPGGLIPPQQGIVLP